jgi:endonuclease YncB( thermonuclease family)
MEAFQLVCLILLAIMLVLRLVGRGAAPKPPPPSPPARPRRPPPSPRPPGDLATPLGQRQAAGLIQPPLTGTAWVVDGDTIVIDGVSIRLFGIDAPEMDHPYGRNARRHMIDLCRGRRIRAEFDGSTSHDRLVARCFLPDGRDLSAEMVRAGLALDWPKYSRGVYRALEQPGERQRLWRIVARQQGRMPPPH